MPGGPWISATSEVKAAATASICRSSKVEVSRSCSIGNAVEGFQRRNLSTVAVGAFGRAKRLRSTAARRAKYEGGSIIGATSNC